MARKPLIAPGSILPAQEPTPGDLLSRIVAKDRARRTGEEVPEVPLADDPETQEPVDTDFQEHGDPARQVPGKTGDRKPRKTDLQETGSTAIQEVPREGAGQPHRNTGAQEARNTGAGREGGGDGLGRQDSAAEPTDKATFDLPRSLHQRLKVQAAMERRPARAILIELLTQYLDEHALF